MKISTLAAASLISSLLLIALPNFASAQAVGDRAVAETSYIQLAALIDDEKRPDRLVYSHEPRYSSWALAVDNDVLAATSRDQDYTYGFNFTYTGSSAKDIPISLDRPLGAIDHLIGIDRLSGALNSHSLEIGLFGFTPENIEIAAPNPADRPYASLIYISSSREQLDINEQVSWKTTLTVGVLGLDMVGSIQNETHEYLDSREAQGWDNQISAGGELTARYAIARQQHLGVLPGNTEIKSTLQASVGYLTEASWSLSARGGKYHTAWSSFNPELASYGEKSTYNSSANPIREHYFWGGAAIKVRAYNAFLQGQFRYSEVAYANSELNPVVVEAWIGYTLGFAEGFRISYVLRGHTSEIKDGDGDRDLLWGGLILSKTIP